VLFWMNMDRVIFVPGVTCVASGDFAGP
jgi:hypothetical protein